MVVLADNDILFKLAAYNLLDAFPNVLGVSRASIRVLGTLPHVARKNPDVQRQYDAATIDRVLDFADGLASPDAAAIPTDVLAPLNQLEDMDPGEALLFADATQHSPCRIVTGDKNCLRALYASDCGDVIDAVSGCVVCLEQLFLWYVAADFAVVRERVVSTPGVDRVLNDVVFSQGADTPKDGAVTALHSYREELRDTTGTLLVDG